MLMWAGIQPWDMVIYPLTSAWPSFWSGAEPPGMSSGALLPVILHALITFFFIFLTSDFDLRQKSFLFLESFLLCGVLSQQQPECDGEQNLEGDNRDRSITPLKCKHVQPQLCFPALQRSTLHKPIHSKTVRHLLHCI